MKKTVLLAALGCALAANAARQEMVEWLGAVNGPIEPGQWNLDFNAGKAYAKEHNTPMLVFWGNTGCSFCANLGKLCGESETFKAWMQERQLVFVAVEADLNVKPWMKTPTMIAAFPFVKIWWPRKDGRVVEANWVGRNSMMPYYNSRLGDPLDIQVIKSTEMYIGDWTPEPPVSYGMFANPDDAGNRLEADANTKSVPVHVVRDPEGALVATDAKLIAVGPSGNVISTVPISWADGQINQSPVSVDVSAAGFTTAGQQVTLYVQSPEGETVATSHITYVDMGNTPKNARWYGEDFDWGEWTVDYHTARARVASTPGAKLIALFSGVLWCPYCKGIENSLFASDEFRNWAKNEKVALVLFDQGRASSPATAEGQLGPRIVTDVVDPNTTGADSVSGLGYMTRKGVQSEVADAYMAMVTAYTKKWLAPGATAVRLSNPTMLLINVNDETVAARFNGSRDADKYYEPTENVRRLGELVKLSGGNESGKYIQTTPYLHNVGATDTAVLQVNENTRYFRLNGVPSEGLLTIRANQEGATLSVWRKGDAKAVASGTGLVEYELDSAAAGYEYYLQVKNDDSVGFTSAIVLVPGEMNKEYGGASPFLIRLAKGANYSFYGVDAADIAAYLTPVATLGGLGIYRANESGDFTFHYEAGAVSMSYLRYNPGSVGFVTTLERIVEPDGEQAVTVKLARTGGSSGEVRVNVGVGQQTTLRKRNGEPRYRFDGVQVSWADGEDGEKSVALVVLGDLHYDGDGVVELVITSDNYGAVDLHDTSYTLNVTENDQPVAGSVAIGNGVSSVYARESQGAEIRVERRIGSDGTASATLKTTAGTLSETALAWADGEADVKIVKLTGLAAGRSATVTLSASSPRDFTIDRTAKTIKVTGMADNAPAFQQEISEWAGVRYVGFPENQYFYVDPAFDGDRGILSFSKVSGKLPSGLKVEADQTRRALTFTGIPTVAGNFEAVYQVSTKVGRTTIKGLTTLVRFKIYDVTDKNAVIETGYNYNTSVFASRTIADIPVVEGRELAGLLTLTIPRTGKVSAKFVCGEGTISFTAAKGWSDYHLETGALACTLASTKKYTLSLNVAADGSLAGAIRDPAVDEPMTFAHRGSLWSKNVSASRYAGYYTVIIDPAGTVAEGRPGIAPTGCGYLTFKMDSASAWNAGKVTWAGMLPNGVTVSGSTVLTEKGELARLPVFKKVSSDVLSGMAAIIRDANELRAVNRRAVLPDADVDTFWLHTESKAEAAEFAAKYNFYGAIYDKNEDLQACCEATELTSTYLFTPDVGGMVSEKYGAFGAVAPVKVKVDHGKISIQTPRTENPQGISFSFARNTGIVNGKFNLPYIDAKTGKTKTVSANWKGVLLIGWGDCGCGDDEPGVIYRPFVNGAFYFSDTVNYVNPRNGRSASLTVKRGGSVRSAKSLE